MAADETPAHSDPGEPCTHPFCVAKAEAEASATPEERDAAQRHGVPVNVLRDIRADRPAAVAGRADEDVYRAAAEAMFEHADGDNDELFAWQNCPSCPNGVRCACSGIPYPSGPVRAAIDAALDSEAGERWIARQMDETHMRMVDFRNGMAMELQPARDLVGAWCGAARAMLDDAPNYTETPIEMTVKAAEHPETFVFILQRVGKLTPHQARLNAEAERDQARAELAEVTRERDEARAETAAERERLAFAVTEIDRARAKALDGGEWQWGVRWGEFGSTTEWGWTEESAREYVAQITDTDVVAVVVRRRLGPVEPVTDDGSTDG